MFAYAQHEEKKKLDQLKKEIEEERQLAELQRLQEESTGKKRTEKLDWMYATPSTAEGGGALGGQRIGEKDMEEYLLGKKRVDEVLKQGDNVSICLLLTGDPSKPKKTDILPTT